MSVKGSIGACLVIDDAILFAIERKQIICYHKTVKVYEFLMKVRR